MSIQPYPKQIFNIFRQTDYTEFTNNVIRDKGKKMINDLETKITSSVVQLSNNSYQNFNTETNPLFNQNIISNYPIRLPPLNSPHWTQNFMNGMGYQKINANMYGALSMPIQIDILKFNGLIYMFLPYLSNILMTNTDKINIDLSAYPELEPDNYIGETCVNFNLSSLTGQQGIAKLNTNLILNISSYISNTGVFLIGNNYDIMSTTLIYKCSKSGY